MVTDCSRISYTGSYRSELVLPSTIASPDNKGTFSRLFFTLLLHVVPSLIYLLVGGLALMGRTTTLATLKHQTSGFS